MTVVGRDWRWGAALAWLGAVAGGCTEPEGGLVVEVLTDLRPGVQFVAVHTTLERDGREEASAGDDVAPGGSWRCGARRVAEWTGLPAGPRVVRVVLREADGEVVLARRLSVKVPSGGVARVTVPLPASCRLVSCPGPADPPSATECIEPGTCASPACLGTGEDCPAAACRDGSACTSPSGTRGRCVAGGCWTGCDEQADGAVPEGGVVPDGGCTERTFYADGDDDGYGDDGSTIQACEAPGGYVARGGDCDDTEGSVNPGATEACNGVDDDCDSDTDEGGDALCTDAAEPECLPSGMCACRPEVSRVSSLRGGTFTLLVPGRTYILCGSCLDEVDQVDLDGTTVSGTFVGSACGGAGGVRFAVPSDLGAAHQLRAVDSEGMRPSAPFSVEVGTLRLNEVDVYTERPGPGGDPRASDAQFVEVCVVDGAGRGVGNVALDGYAVRVYLDDGSRIGNWPLHGERTADGGCMLLGHAPARPTSWPGDAWITLTPDAHALPGRGAVTIEMGRPTGTASDSASVGRVLDAVVYSPAGMTFPSNLAGLLVAGATVGDMPIDSDSTNSIPRCDDTLRDNRAWRGNPTAPTKGALTNNCM